MSAIEFYDDLERRPYALKSASYLAPVGQP
jgi:hypothetical protein